MHFENDRGRLSPLAISAAIHALLVGGVLLLPARTDNDDPEPIDIVFYSPEEVERKVVERPEPPQPPEIAELEPPVRRKPPIERNVPSPRPVRQPEPPKAKVRTDLFAEKPEALERPQPERTVARAGFATEDAAAAPGPARRPRVVANGSFADEAMAVPARPAEREAVATAAFDASDETETPRPERAAVRSVATTGFGAEAAGDDAAPSRGADRGSVTAGGFADGVAKASAPRTRRQPREDPDTPVVIVSKPKPVYTDEARQRRVEGEVVLKVTFVSSGRLRIHGVVGSLGFGLDEAAVKAAEKIEFTPARRNGRPVDHTATLRVVFRLA